MRTLLIGTDETLDTLRAQLGLAGERAPIVGASSPERALDAARAHGAERAVVCLPAERAGERAALFEALRARGVVVREVPVLAECLASEPRAGVPAARSIEVGSTIDAGELVGRARRPIDDALAGSAITGRTVLITGAGGSIGSELARACAQLRPARLVIMDRAETGLFEIDRWLGDHEAGVARSAVLHDVVEAQRTGELLEQYRPDVVFHAAAHKHVPLLEDHPASAVTNNLFGTKAVADAALAVGAERFVLISTDKAVHPSSVMGATKRLAETYVHALASWQRESGAARTRLCMVRFGNVLGSAGSVLTVWGQQLAEGHAVTLTDRRMTRYFMTIPEAAGLVVQAGALSGAGNGSSGEVFVLDMGEPVRIADLAERFCRVHGLEPSWSGAPGCAHLVETGIRPGEKLHEVLSYEAEALGQTLHPSIRVLRRGVWPGRGEVEAMLREMSELRRGGAPEAVASALHAWMERWGGSSTGEGAGPGAEAATLAESAA
ncbi:MAG: polysaccharide biosynthesis protein [Planctomycetota bacterium]